MNELQTHIDIFLITIIYHNRESQMEQGHVQIMF